MTQDAASPQEQHDLKASHVYLDASVYRSLQFDWDNRWLSALADLARRGLVRVVVTEITRREVESLMREMWSEANKSVQRSAVVLGQAGLGDTVSALADEKACVGKMQASFEKWLRCCSVWTCKYDPDLSAIMGDYFEGKPPFGMGRKKAEFPDAIVASMLRIWCAATKQSVYVVSQDGDLKACCSPEGPLIHAGSVAEVVSHGTASVKVHDAVVAAVRTSDWFLQTMQDRIEDLPVEVERGYRRGARVGVECESVKLEDMSIDDVIVVEFDGTQMTCAVYLTGEIAIRADVEQESVQYGESDWDPGYRHTQRLSLTADLTATVTASLRDDETVELDDASLDDRRIRLPWRDVEWVIE